MPWEELWDEKTFDSGMLILEFKNPDGLIVILPLIEYADWLDDSEVFSDLTWAISNGDEEDLQSCIPIPLTPCDKQVYNLQVEKLRFQNGSGIRSVSAQIINNTIFLGNESMLYSFHGLTTDQRFYISGNFELDHENLPENDWVFNFLDDDIGINEFGEFFSQLFTDDLSQIKRVYPQPGQVLIPSSKSLRVEAE